MAGKKTAKGANPQVAALKGRVAKLESQVKKLSKWAIGMKAWAKRISKVGGDSQPPDPPGAFGK
jgi:hypothetical protein